MVAHSNARGVNGKIVLSWWALHNLRKKDSITTTKTTGARKSPREHGVEVPSSTCCTHEIDRKNKQ